MHLTWAHAVNSFKCPAWFYWFTVCTLKCFEWWMHWDNLFRKVISHSAFLFYSLNSTSRLWVFVLRFFLTMSVPRSMQRIVMVPRGRGMLTKMKKRKGVISGMLLVRVYAIDFFRLSKIRRPGKTKVVYKYNKQNATCSNKAWVNCALPI